MDSRDDSTTGGRSALKIDAGATVGRDLRLFTPVVGGVEAREQTDSAGSNEENGGNGSAFQATFRVGESIDSVSPLAPLLRVQDPVARLPPAPPLPRTRVADCWHAFSARRQSLWLCHPGRPGCIE
jgi:hypothetical protein